MSSSFYSLYGNPGVTEPQTIVVSAYDIWLSLGYTGTPEDFIQFLRGEGGIPPGGLPGQVLSKVNETDYNVQWIDPPAGGGGGGGGGGPVVNPVVLSPIDNQIMTEGRTSTFTPLFTGSTPTWSISGPTWATINFTTGLVTLSPPFNTIGSFTINITANNSVSVSSRTLTVTVTSTQYRTIALQGQSGAKFAQTMIRNGQFNVPGRTRPAITGSLGFAVEMDQGTTIVREINNQNFQNESGGYIVSRGGHAVANFMKWQEPDKIPVLVLLASSGKSMAGLLSDGDDVDPDGPGPEEAGWIWQHYKNTIDYTAANFAPIELLQTFWYGTSHRHDNYTHWTGRLDNGTPHTTGLALNNAVVGAGSPSVDHYIFDTVDGNDGSFSYTLRPPKLEYAFHPNNDLSAPERASVAATFQTPLLAPLDLGNHPVSMSGHIDDSNDYAPLHSMEVIIPGYLKLIGRAPVVPTIESIIMNPTRTSVEVTVNLPNGGNLSTVRRQNSIPDPSTPHPLYTSIYGFEFAPTTTTPDASRVRLDRASWTTQITDPGSGTVPNRKGKVLLTPNFVMNESSRMTYRMGGMPNDPQPPQEQMPWFNHLVEEIPSLKQPGALWQYPGPQVAPMSGMTVLLSSGIQPQPLSSSPSATLPADLQLDDLMVAIVARSGSSLPSNAAGWTQRAQFNGTGTQFSFIVSTKTFVPGDQAPVFVNASDVEIHRFGKDHYVGNVAFDGALTGETINLPALVRTGSTAWQIAAFRSRNSSQNGWTDTAIAGWRRVTDIGPNKRTYVRNDAQTVLSAVSSPTAVTGTNGGAGVHIEIVRP